jgi:hypothetical protein
VLLMLLFPSGRPASRFWGRVAWTVVASSLVAALALAFASGPVDATIGVEVANPYGAPGDLGEVLAATAKPAFFWMIALFAVSIGSVVIRQRRAEGLERIQLRWFTSAVGLVVVVGSGALTILAALDPQLGLRDEPVSVANPIGVAWLGDVEEPPVAFVLFPILVISSAGAVASLVARFRRASGEERQQLKWFTYAGVILIAGFVIFGVLDASIGDRVTLIEPVLLSLPPVAAGIAILRYRLYDIDLVINRTLVYAALTGFLGLVYVAGVVGLSQLLPVEGNDLAVAGSTLAVAALFSPARRRIQAFVDRRFYRRRYDAARTVEAFSSRLRDQVDLETLRSDLVGVERETLQPSSVEVWIKEAGGSGR